MLGRWIQPRWWHWQLSVTADSAMTACSACRAALLLRPLPLSWLNPPPPHLYNPSSVPQQPRQRGKDSEGLQNNSKQFC